MYNGSIDFSASLQHLPSFLNQLGNHNIDIFTTIRIVSLLTKYRHENAKRWKRTDPKPGDHLKVQRNWFYSHHGILSENETVIHFAGRGNEISAKNRIIIEEPFDMFTKGGKIEVLSIDADLRLSTDESIERARSRIGESDYKLLFNNCEHFANWCVNDRHHSWQVEQFGTVLAQILHDAGYIEEAQIIRSCLSDQQSFGTLIEKLLRKSLTA
jgi:hypothetical protein